MGRVEAYTIPARLCLTAGHFVAVVMALYHEAANARSGLAPGFSSSDEAEARQELRRAIGLALACFALDAVGIFGAVSIFFGSVNLTQSALHFLGGLYTCWFVLYEWHYASYWTICGLFSVLPALVEAGALARVFVFKAVPY